MCAHVHAHNIRNNSSGRFKLVSCFDIHPAKEKVLLTGFKIFEVVPRLKKKREREREREKRKKERKKERKLLCPV
jgi:hypothetical protein